MTRERVVDLVRPSDSEPAEHSRSFKRGFRKETERHGIRTTIVRQQGTLTKIVETSREEETAQGPRITRTTTTTIEPALIEYQDVRNAVVVERDEDASETPWENWDGWTHDTEDYAVWYSRSIKGVSLECADTERLARIRTAGHQLATSWRTIRGRCTSLLHDHRKMRIILREDGDYGYFRAQGASKQVAFELAACQKRRRLDQLVTWYSEGWTWWHVACEFRGYRAGLSGIDDEAYATGEVAEQLTAEVVGYLENAGYIVANQPKSQRKPNKRERRKRHRERLQQNLHSQDWSD